MSKETRKKPASNTAGGISNISKVCDALIFILLLATIVLIPLYFNINSFDQFEMPKLTLLRILTCAMLALWAVKSADKGAFEFTPTPLDIPLLLWVIMNIITTFTSFAPQLSFRGEYENFAGSLSNINYVVIFYIASQNIKTKKQIETIAYMILATGVLMTIYSIAQFFGVDFVSWNEGSKIAGRYFASMGNPNFLGALLTMMIPFGISFAIDGYGSKNDDYLFRFGFFKVNKKTFSVSNIFILILMFMALLGTQSRGPMAAFAASLLVYIIIFFIYLADSYSNLKKNISPVNHVNNFSFLSYIGSIIKKNYMILLGLFAAVLIAVILSFTVGKDATTRLFNSITHPKESFATSRLHIWVPALRIIKDNPLLGTGVDTFKSVFPKYEGTNFAQIDGANVSSRTAHFELLNIAATMGITALGIYILLIYAYLVMCFRSFSRTPPGSLKLVSYAVFAGVVAYLVQNFVSFGVAAINTYLYIFFALHAVLYAQFYNTKSKYVRFYRAGDSSAVFVKYSIIIPSVLLALFLGYRAYMMYSADVHYNRGKIYGGVYNKWDEAVKEHIKSVEEEPNEVKYQVYLALAYERLAMATQDRATQLQLLHNAAVIYKKGVDLNPGNSYYWGNLGRIYTALGKSEDPKYFDDAERYYLIAVEKAPVTGLFASNLIELYLGIGRIDKALPLMDKLEGCDKALAASSYFLLGNIYFGQKLYIDAEKAYRKSVDLNPAAGQTYYNLGVVCAARGDRDCAKFCMEKYIELMPGSDKDADAKKILRDVSR